MAGRTPSEAVDSFLAPIQQAASCLGACKVTCTSGAQHAQLGVQHTWMLNGGDGIVVRSTSGDGGRLRLDASMYWVLIEDDREEYGPFRVTTRGYEYSLRVADEIDPELWALHWHHHGNSSERKPHLHLGNRALSVNARFDSKGHLPTPRMTFEMAVRWAIEWSAQPAHPDWADRLALAETPHLLYRTWVQNPADAAPEALR